jgi:hypothetical protein
VDNVHVDLDQDAIDAMFSDPDGDIARAIYEAADEITQVARALAPISSRGSRYAPPGTLKRQIHSVHGHNDDGDVAAFVGISRTTTRGYPLNFVWNSKGSTFNRGHHSSRPASNAFLLRALETTVLIPVTRI